MKKIRDYIQAHWRPLLILIAAMLVLGFVYVFRLSTLTHRKLSDSEFIEKSDFASLHSILKNPINALYKIVDYVFLCFHPHSTGYTRLTSVLFAILACALFYVIVYRWHGRRSAILATALFGTSGWLLHVGRLGTPDIMFVLIPLSLMLLASWANNTDQHGLALLYLTLVAGLAFYTPGAIWFLILGSILIRKAVIRHLKHARTWEKTVCIVITLCLAGLLGFSMYRNVHIIREWLFIPTSLPSPLTLIKQWIDTIAYLFVRGPLDPSAWLGHAPILDAFTGIMTLVGSYFYATHFKNLRSHMLLAFFALGSVLVALNGAVAMGFIVPLAYLLAATGITYLLHTWFTVFPRNPVARGIGITLISAVAVVAISYHMTSYFVAWRYDPVTIKTFQQNP